MNKKVMKFIIKDVREKIKKKIIPFTNIILITNGSLIDKEIAKFLKVNKVLVAISLDGPKKINDMNRLTVKGKGTYDSTVKAINLFNEIGIRPTISCTINNNNVNALREIIDWFMKNFKLDSLGLNLFSGGYCSNKNVKRLSKDSAKEIINAFKVCRELGIYEDTVIRQVKSFVEERPNFYYCAATGREISVDPEGNLATCPAFLNNKMFPMNISQKPDIINNKEFKKWAKRTPFLNKNCYRCIALGICGGGCAFNAYKNHKDINGMDDFYCNYAKNITKWLLADLYSVMQGKK